MKNTITAVLAAMMTLSASIDANAQDKKEDKGNMPLNVIVTDLAGNPLKHVRAYINNPKSFATSDRKGRIGLSRVKDDDTLHITYRKELYIIPLEGRHGLRVRLGDQINTLAEKDEHLVDLGYGFVKRREHNGASTGITRDELIQSGQTNLMLALQFRVPGLAISNSGRPGEKSTTRIRGINSINSSTEPLFLVDGMEVETLDNISVYEVDYVEVMKGSNIYGARGANGVISVHTRR